jgi:hypothetical protein
MHNCDLNSVIEDKHPGTVYLKGAVTLNIAQGSDPGKEKLIVI